MSQSSVTKLSIWSNDTCSTGFGLFDHVRFYIQTNNFSVGIPVFFKPRPSVYVFRGSKWYPCIHQNLLNCASRSPELPATTRLQWLQCPTVKDTSIKSVWCCHRQAEVDILYVWLHCGNYFYRDRRSRSVKKYHLFCEQKQSRSRRVLSLSASSWWSESAKYSATTQQNSFLLTFAFGTLQTALSNCDSRFHSHLPGTIHLSQDFRLRSLRELDFLVTKMILLLNKKLYLCKKYFLQCGQIFG